MATCMLDACCGGSGQIFALSPVASPRDAAPLMSANLLSQLGFFVAPLGIPAVASAVADGSFPLGNNALSKIPTIILETLSREFLTFREQQ